MTAEATPSDASVTPAAVTDERFLKVLSALRELRALGVSDEALAQAEAWMRVEFADQIKSGVDASQEIRIDDSTTPTVPS